MMVLIEPIKEKIMGKGKVRSLNRDNLKEAILQACHNIGMPRVVHDHTTPSPVECFFKNFGKD